MTIDLTIEDERWTALRLDLLAKRAIDAALTCLGHDPEACGVGLLGCDDARIAALNTEFRGKPAPTNVLSWPAEDLSPDIPGAMPRSPERDFTGEIALGDIAIAWQTCAREAAEQGKPMADHATHLIVHGLLHLLGYDHVRDPDATLMETTETEILGKLGIGNPYYSVDGP